MIYRPGEINGWRLDGIIRILDADLKINGDATQLEDRQVSSRLGIIRMVIQAYFNENTPPR